MMKKKKELSAEAPELEPEFEIPSVEIKNQDDLYNLIFEQDDITWQAVILELAREGKINPWDIDISVLAQEYLQIIKKLKEHNFRLSGKVILAGAILLRLKADRLGVDQLLALMNPEKYADDDSDTEDDGFDLDAEKRFTKAGLNLRIPGVRKRKVTVFELVESLKRALDVDDKRQRRLAEITKVPVQPLPEIKRVDIFAKIEAVFSKLKDFVKRFKKKTVEFDEIVPSKEKKDIIWTFIPLLHLANQDKIVLRQDEHFGKIYVDIKEAELAKGLQKEEVEKQAEVEEIKFDENGKGNRKSARNKGKN